MPRTLLWLVASLCLGACTSRGPIGHASVSPVGATVAAARGTVSTDDGRGHFFARLARTEGYVELPRMRYTIHVVDGEDFRRPGRVFVRGITDETGLLVVDEVPPDDYRIVVPGARENEVILALPLSDRDPQIVTFNFEDEPEREPDPWWSDW